MMIEKECIDEFIICLVDWNKIERCDESFFFVLSCNLLHRSKMFMTLSCCNTRRRLKGLNCLSKVWHQPSSEADWIEYEWTNETFVPSNAPTTFMLFVFFFEEVSSGVSCDVCEWWIVREITRIVQFVSNTSQHRQAISHSTKLWFRSLSRRTLPVLELIYFSFQHNWMNEWNDFVFIYLISCITRVVKVLDENCDQIAPRSRLF